MIVRSDITVKQIQRAINYHLRINLPIFQTALIIAQQHQQFTDQHIPCTDMLLYTAV